MSTDMCVMGVRVAGVALVVVGAACGVGGVGGCCQRLRQEAADLGVFSTVPVMAPGMEGGSEVFGERYSTVEPRGIATLAVARLQETRQEKGEAGASVRLVRARDDGEIDRLLERAGLGRSRTDLIDLGERCGSERWYRREEMLACARGARVRWLFVYTVGLTTETEYVFAPLVLFTLGFAPNAVSSAEAVGSGAIIDVESETVLDRWTVTEEAWQPAIAWNADVARDQSARRSERRVVERVFERLGQSAARLSPGSGWMKRESWGE